ncbi:MAG TPA: hypothetical protein DEQ43_02145, partial [Nocardioides bacterium]|nr:hypothetical protein [Nocardioides sp.]
MGYTTDFIGHFDIDPLLNQDEIEYLTAFSMSRRFARSDGPYAVPGNPMAVRDKERAEVDYDTYNTVASGQPQLYCQWVPCLDGCCLTFDGNEKFYQPVAWLRYLILHLLKPGAVAARTGLEAFEHFTFDHHLNGMVVGCRRDTKELFAITVKANRVTERVLRPGEPEHYGQPPLAYEQAIDWWANSTRRRRRVPPDEPQPGGVDPARARAAGG